MARGRRLQADMNSAEIEHLIRTQNTLIKILGNLSASLTAGASADEALQALGAGIASGVDNNPNGIANVVTTGEEVVGLNRVPNRPRRPGTQVGQQLEDLD